MSIYEYRYDNHRTIPEFFVNRSSKGESPSWKHNESLQWNRMGKRRRFFKGLREIF